MFQIPPGKWTGLTGMADRELRGMMKTAQHAVLQAVVFGASEVKKTLTGQRHGRLYRVNVSGKRDKQGHFRDRKGRYRRRRIITHVAAAPGEAPAVLFGNLRNSIGWDKPMWEGNKVLAAFGVGLGTKPKGGVQDPSKTYGRIQEFGGLAGPRHARVRIPAHPYLEPTAVRISPQIEAMLEQAFT